MNAEQQCSSDSSESDDAVINLTGDVNQTEGSSKKKCVLVSFGNTTRHTFDSDL